jgi:hypothetical protein
VEEEIKSAFELAMERVSRMPKLTPEEMAEQKEREYGPLGTAIAVRYRNGALSDTDLPRELSRYDGSQQAIVRRALISRLCLEIQLEKGLGAARRALNGLMQIAPEKTALIDQCREGFLKIAGEFEGSKEKGSGEFAITAKEQLRGLGISGAAVRPNIEESEQWKEELSRIRQSFEPELEQLRNSLIQTLS